MLQCGIAASRNNQIIKLIRKNIAYEEKYIMLPLHKAVVRPHFLNTVYKLGDHILRRIEIRLDEYRGGQLK